MAPTANPALQSQLLETVGSTNFTVPSGVNVVYVTMCAGGGGGWDSLNGAAGGNTSFGTYICYGGGGGTNGGGGALGGTSFGEIGDRGFRYGAGGYGGPTPAVIKNGRGSGAGGGGFGGTIGGAGTAGQVRAGGGGGCVERYPISVTPGSVISVSIGAGGNAGFQGDAGHGSKGFCLIEWISLS